MSTRLKPKEIADLKSHFKATVAFLTAMNQCHAYSEEDEICFVQAKGDPEKAEAFLRHGWTFAGCSNVDWSRVFSGPDGWPDLRVRAKYVAVYDKEDYWDGDDNYPKPDFV